MVDLNDLRLEIHQCDGLEGKRITAKAELKVTFFRVHHSGFNSVINSTIKVDFIPLVDWAILEVVDLQKDPSHGCHRLRIPDLAVGVKYRLKFEVTVHDPDDPENPDLDQTVIETIPEVLVL